MAHSFSSTQIRRFTWLFAFAILLSACAVEGGLPPATPTGLDASPAPQPTDAAAAEALAARADTWVVGLLEAPRNLYPYQPTVADQRRAAPITELLFPSPVLAYNYGYTTTGVLEQVPTLENGGAAIQKADVFLDAAGNITTTTTTVITQVDQLVVTFRWNPKLTWSDGQPVTAADSVFAYNMAKAAPPSADARERLAQTVAYEQVDEHTTRAVLKPDLTGSTYYLNYWTPLPQHLLKDSAPDQIATSDYARAPIGYGAYALASGEANALHLTRNPHYFGAPPPVSRVDFQFPNSIDLLRSGVLNGNIDVGFTDRMTTDLFEPLDKLQSDGQAQVFYQPTPIWEHIDFNLDVRTLQDIRIRRAIALGINRQAIADAVFKGHVAVLDSWVLPGQPEAAPADQITHYTYDPDGARALLEEAGYTDPDGDGLRSAGDGTPLKLQLMTTSNTPLRADIATRLEADLKAIGIAVERIEVPSEQFIGSDGPLYQRQFELALFAWSATPDASGASLWSCGAVPSLENNFTGENFAGWCMRDANRAILRGSTTLDAAQRQADYLAQQQLWTRELPSLPLFQRLSASIAAPGVQNLKPDTFAPLTWNIAAWQRTPSEQNQ